MTLPERLRGLGSRRAKTLVTEVRAAVQRLCGSILPYKIAHSARDGFETNTAFFQVFSQVDEVTHRSLDAIVCPIIVADKRPRKRRYIGLLGHAQLRSVGQPEASSLVGLDAENLLTAAL